MIITTRKSIEGQTIHEYRGIVVGEAIVGPNIVRDFFASITDVIGGRSGPHEQKLADEARALAKRMVGRTCVLGQNKSELRALSSSELDQLADYARCELRNHLRAFEG